MIQRPRLLVIDDDPMIQKLLAVHLRKDFFIFSATNGQDGVSLANSNRPDVITVDLQMPGWDGIETVRNLRSNRKLTSIPVLILSAGSEKTSVIRSIQAGANDYLIKEGAWHEQLATRLNRLIAASGAALLPKLVKAAAPALTPTEWNQAVADLARREAIQNFEDGF